LGVASTAQGNYSGGDWKGHAEGSPEASPFWGLRPEVGEGWPLWRCAHEGCRRRPTPLGPSPSGRGLARSAQGGRFQSAWI